MACHWTWHSEFNLWDSLVAADNQTPTSCLPNSMYQLENICGTGTSRFHSLLAVKLWADYQMAAHLQFTEYRARLTSELLTIHGICMLSKCTENAREHSSLLLTCHPKHHGLKRSQLLHVLLLLPWFSRHISKSDTQTWMVKEGNEIDKNHQNSIKMFTTMQTIQTVRLTITHDRREMQRDILKIINAVLIGGIYTKVI